MSETSQRRIIGVIVIVGLLLLLSVLIPGGHSPPAEDAAANAPASTTVAVNDAAHWDQNQAPVAEPADAASGSLQRPTEPEPSAHSSPEDTGPELPPSTPKPAALPVATPAASPLPAAPKPLAKPPANPASIPSVAAAAKPDAHKPIPATVIAAPPIPASGKSLVAATSIAKPPIADSSKAAPQIATNPVEASKPPIPPSPSAPSTARAPSPPSTSSSASTASLSWYVQVASYGEEANAQSAVAHLKSAGLNAAVSRITDTSGKTFYRVRIGPFESVGSADETLGRVQSQGYPSARRVSE